MPFRSSAGILVGAFGCAKTVVVVLHERTNNNKQSVGGGENASGYEDRLEQQQNRVSRNWALDEENSTILKENTCR